MAAAKKAAPVAEEAKMIKVTLVKSTIASLPQHKATIEALGLRKIGSANVMVDNQATRGMVRKVIHLVKVEEI